MLVRTVRANEQVCINGDLRISVQPRGKGRFRILIDGDRDRYEVIHDDPGAEPGYTQDRQQRGGQP